MSFHFLFLVDSISMCIDYYIKHKSIIKTKIDRSECEF